jgi:rhodanese-related sulfurtransferase
MTIPEITVQELNNKLISENKFILLDVREIWEVEQVSLKDNRLHVLPMSQLVEKGVESIPAELQNKESQLCVLCHHGIRSAQVTHWLTMQGWSNVYSVYGGIDAYAREIDHSIGFY